MTMGLFSKKAGSKEVGGAHVTVSADTKPLEEGLDSVVTKTETATKKIDNSFSGMTERLQANVSKQVGVILGLIGAVTAAVGVFTLFVNIGRKVGDMLFDTSKSADLLAESIEANKKALSDYAARLRANLPEGFVGDTDADVAKLGALQDKIEKLQGTLSKVSRRDLEGALARLATQTTEMAIKRKLEPLEAEAKALQDRLNAIEKRGLGERRANERKAREDAEAERQAADDLFQHKRVAREAWLLREKVRLEVEGAEEIARRTAEIMERQMAASAKAFGRELAASVSAGLGQAETRLNGIAITVERMAQTLQKINGQLRP